MTTRGRLVLATVTGVLLLAAVGSVYTGGPFSPCRHDLASHRPQATFDATLADERLTVTHDGGDKLPGRNPENRVYVLVRDDESGHEAAVEWGRPDDRVEVGDALVVRGDRLPFDLTRDDTVRVVWYGDPSDTPSWCPNHRGLGNYTMGIPELADT